MFRKKEKDEKETEKIIYLTTKRNIQTIKNLSDLKTKEEIYQDVTSCFKSYFISILKSDNFLTEHELILMLKNFNIDKVTIEKVDGIFMKLIQIDYNNKTYTKEEIFNIITDFEIALDEINAQRRAYHMTLMNKIYKHNKNKIISKFESNLKLLKKKNNINNIKNINFSDDLITLLIGYYNYLPDTQKERFSKEYYYLCKTLPSINLLVTNLKTTKETTQKERLVSEIKKLFSKIEEDKKYYFYNEIIPFLTYEENIWFLLTLGHFEISRKNTKNAINIYNNLFRFYSKLDTDNKTYYYPLLLNYANSIKKKM